MKLFIFISIPFLFINSIVNAQNKQKVDSILSIINKTQVDTLKAANYLDLVNLTLYNNPEDAKAYIEKSLALYQKTKHSKGLAKCYKKKATYFYVISYKDSVRYYLNKSIDAYLQLRDTVEAARVRYNIGILDLTEGNYKKCLDIMDTNISIFEKAKKSVDLGSAYMMKGKVALHRGFYNIALTETYRALKIHQKIESKLEIAEDLFQIGKLQNDLNKHKEAISSYNDSYIIYDNLDYDQPKSQSLCYMGSSYLSLKKYDEAREAFEKALQISKAIDYKTNIARIYVNLGTLEYELHNYSKSKMHLEKGIQLWESLAIPYNEADAKLNMGKTYLAQKEYPKAIEYFNEGLRIADTIDASKLLERGYLNRAISFERLGKYKAAYLDHKKSKIVNDTLLIENQAKVIEELNIIYETEKKEQQIDSQNKAIKILEQESKIKNLQRVILFVILLLVGLLFIFSVYRIRKKNKERLQQTQNEKLKSDLALANRENELKKVVLENSITEEVLNKTLNDIKEIITFENEKERKSALRSLSAVLLSEKSTQKTSPSLQSYLDEVHMEFKIQLDTKCPELTDNEKELIYLMKAGLSSSKISKVLNTTLPAIKSNRYRLRKKLNLNSNDDIIAFLDKKFSQELL